MIISARYFSISTKPRDMSHHLRCGRRRVAGAGRSRRCAAHAAWSSEAIYFGTRRLLRRRTPPCALFIFTRPPHNDAFRRDRKSLHISSTLVIATAFQEQKITGLPGSKCHMSWPLHASISRASATRRHRAHARHMGGALRTDFSIFISHVTPSAQMMRCVAGVNAAEYMGALFA